MESRVNHLNIAKKRCAIWKKADCVRPQSMMKEEARCIMMPPPNITGSLHIGHALNLTLQDILVRFWRMQGYNVLWQPGMDHAGIATQMMVKKHLQAQNVCMEALGRDGFTKAVWDWKEKFGCKIVNQQKQLCISPDWSRERFTLDEDLSQAVTEAFVRLYDQGFVYHGEKLVNWDLTLQTALSDLEVKAQVQSGPFLYIRYPVVKGTHLQDFVTVATTRPETLFGDVAVAVHPEDPRYSRLIGSYVHVPLTDRTIPIIADTYCDMQKGTGAVKITPAHDFNDFDVGLRHQLPCIIVIDTKGCMTGSVTPSVYQGLFKDKAREVVVQALKAQGLLHKTETIDVTTMVGQRSGGVVEPRLTPQWFVDTKKLAHQALEAVAQGQTTFIPENWTKTYRQWLSNIQPWCVSRQLWWGHQIPVWHGPDNHFFVARSLEEAQDKAQKHYGRSVTLTQDPDVLDTWFSSALWPFSTLGWPRKSIDFKKFYPTTVLITAFDIIFFWVARMMMMGLFCTKKVPFSSVYIHGLVLDSKGQKMSKTKGNVVDPLEIVSQHGADSLRFSLARQAAFGMDIRFDRSHLETANRFCTKLWNCGRFYKNTFTQPLVSGQEIPEHFINRWILARSYMCVCDTTEHLNQYRYDLALDHIYQFVRIDFCDWYLELSKVILAANDPMTTLGCHHTMACVLKTILLLHHSLKGQLIHSLKNTQLHFLALLIFL